MNTRILAALAAACLATPALAGAHEPFGPVCALPPAVMRQMPADATAVMLDGDEAARMLAAINAADPPTEFRASTILIRLFRDHALVVLFDPCAVTTVPLSLGEMQEAWEAARGVRA